MSNNTTNTAVKSCIVTLDSGARIFDTALVTPDRYHEIKYTCNGSYGYMFKGVATGERLEKASKGFSLEACNLMANRFIVFESRNILDENGSIKEKRFLPIPEQFTEDERSIVFANPGASFSYKAIRENFSNKTSNMLFNERRLVCVDCGKIFNSFDNYLRHDCDAIPCSICGGAMTKEEIERGFGICHACAKTKAGKLYDYHCRPRGSSPIFEKFDDRVKFAHLGAEIEIEGDDGEAFDRYDAAKDFNEILNAADYYKPFVEFEKDGSINEGVEVITAPTTFKGFKQHAADITAFYEKANELGGKFYKKNGLHFHIDRTFFGADGSEELAKAAILIDAMVYKYFDFFATICRRRRDCFGYAFKKSGVDGVMSAALNAHRQEHSMAVNGSGYNTIELRIFGGEIKTADNFFAALDITHALAMWAKKTSLTSAEKATPCSLIKYIKDKANVLAFVLNLNPDAPHTTNGDKWLTDFIDKLTDCIAKEGK